MFKLLIAVLLGAVAYLLVDQDRREWLMEQAREASDVAVSSLLRLTSQFGEELTPDGWAEQQQWREQRLRDMGARVREKRA